MFTATSRFFRPDPRTIEQCEPTHRGRFSARHIPVSTVVVTVEGEVDASNDRLLAAYVERQIAGCAHLVLDLEPVAFFGAAGFAALHHVNLVCARNNVKWMLRVGPRVSRLLSICDPDGCLPLEQHQSFPLLISGTN